MGAELVIASVPILRELRADAREKRLGRIHRLPGNRQCVAGLFDSVTVSQAKYPEVVTVCAAPIVYGDETAIGTPIRCGEKADGGRLRKQFFAMINGDCIAEIRVRTR
jgi:hypothetical protein